MYLLMVTTDTVSQKHCIYLFNEELNIHLLMVTADPESQTETLYLFI